MCALTTTLLQFECVAVFRLHERIADKSIRIRLILRECGNPRTSRKNLAIVRAFVVVASCNNESSAQSHTVASFLINYLPGLARARARA